ncbi:hypothetical protein DEO23_13995 [Brachybacterium endophyticum]|uniref:NodB homology domain-containing protein n=1 Tax=Brachybacterium endophyticum TaxID=2182385 RepID=A0A2U2RH61_9MICO|nr:polysaccharide deacetylase family protein [Brachybacterium endophyticum]PWH05188.1 hypothetical protein DEO23_13995 [Brachybacterium endophyticum]
MAETLPNGVVVPNADGGETISVTGVAETRALGASVDAQLAVLLAGMGAGGWKAEEIGTRHLDQMKTPGVYWQSYANYATTAQGYPYPRAGHLIVTANTLGTQVTQRYVTFDPNANARWSTRNYYGTWDQWRDIPLGGQDTDDDEEASPVFRGVVASGTDVNTLREPGIYSVPTVAVAGTLLNFPTKRAATIEVWSNDGSAMTSQRVVAMVSATAPAEIYDRATLSALNTSWGPWSSPEWIKGKIAGTADAPVNIDTYRTPGAWAITTRSNISGLPGSGLGLLEVVTNQGFSLSMQRFTERVANDDIRVWHRYSLSTGGWTGIEWDLLNEPAAAGGGGGTANSGRAVQADVQTSDHAARVEYARARRGGGIGTNGVPVVMIRFDHWLVAFRDKCLPALQDNSLVGTLNVNYDNLGNEQNGGGSITWEHVQAWNQYDGIEIANHGSTHTNVNTQAAIYHEIVDGRRNLEKAMPRVAVETWQEHGSAYLIASDIDGDEGLDLGRSLEAFTESYAGRLVMGEHAIVEGKIGGFYPPLTGEPQIGQSHFSIDRQSSDQTISTVQFAQQVNRGLTIYLHPGLLDTILVGTQAWSVTYGQDGSRTVTPSGATGEVQNFPTDAAMREWATTNGHIVYQTTDDFRRVCEWLKAERDAGRIMVMSAGGGNFADIHHGRRENILMRGSWSGSGWTRTGEGDGYQAVSNGNASTMSQGMLLFTRFGWAMGAAHELVIQAKADTATTLTLSMEQLGNPGNWKTERTFDVPGDGILRTYRLNLTLPRDRSITQMTARVGGPNLTIQGEPLLAAI